MAKPTSHKAPCERQKNSPASEIKTVLLTRVEIGELEISQPGQGAAGAHTVCDTASASRDTEHLLPHHEMLHGSNFRRGDCCTTLPLFSC